MTDVFICYNVSVGGRRRISTSYIRICPTSALCRVTADDSRASHLQYPSRSNSSCAVPTTHVNGAMTVLHPQPCAGRRSSPIIHKPACQLHYVTTSGFGVTGSENVGVDRDHTGRGLGQQVDRTGSRCLEPLRRWEIY
jgi:hypothetical protein